MEIAMSSIYRDPKRKVSEPTEADFIRGLAGSISKSRGNANMLMALAAGLLAGKALRRGK